MEKENDILETTLAVAEQGYAEAYRYLLDAYEKNAQNCGPQTLYFLACLAGGADLPEQSVAWLRKSIADNSWWYRPEVLEDDDLASLKENEEFVTLKSISDARYAEAVKVSKPLFSWQAKTADCLLLAVHGNTQNEQTARCEWEAVMGGNDRWQLETIRSGEPDGFGSYRWSYDSVSYLPVANALEKVQNEGYKSIACGGFSAGCDMLLRAITLTSARCDLLVLQSPWIPFLEEHGEDLVRAIRSKGIALRISCGDADEDCLPMAQQLYALLNREKIDVELNLQPGDRHQFPKKPQLLKKLFD